jgi:hypothetical protein
MGSLNQMGEQHVALRRRSIFVGELFNSTLLLTFILFWTLSHNYVHLF